MTTALARWGNSLAVRIPRALAEQAGVAAGDRVSLEVTSEGSVVIHPVRPRYSLQDLVGRITARNRHDETNWDGPSGRESW